MKEIYPKLKECKTLKEIINILPNEFFIKISYYGLLLWCLVPILILLANIFVKYKALFWFLYILRVVGVLGILNGIIYMYKNKLKIYKQIPFILLIVFLAWTFICCLLAENKNYAFIGEPYRQEGFFTYLCYAGFFLNGIVVSKEKKYIKNLLKCIIISSTTVGLLAVMNNGLSEILLKNANVYFSSYFDGIFSQHNHYGYYLNISILIAAFLFIYEKKYINNIIYILIYLLSIYVLEKNTTLGCWVASCFTLVVALIYYVIIKQNRLKIVLLIGLFLLMTLTSNMKNDVVKLGAEVGNITKHIDKLDVYVDDTIGSKYVLCSGTGRLDLWIKGIELIKRKPIFGYGLENLKKDLNKITVCDRYNDRPHNTFIQIGADTGIIGLLIYLSTLISIFITGLKNSKKLDSIVICCFFVVTGYLASSFFGNSMFYTSPYYIFILGIISTVCIKTDY